MYIHVSFGSLYRRQRGGHYFVIGQTFFFFNLVNLELHWETAATMTGFFVGALNEQLINFQQWLVALRVRVAPTISFRKRGKWRRKKRREGGNRLCLVGCALSFFYGGRLEWRMGRQTGANSQQPTDPPPFYVKTTELGKNSRRRWSRYKIQLKFPLL